MAKRKLPNAKNISPDKLVIEINELNKDVVKIESDVERLQDNNSQLRSDVDRQEKAIDNLIKSNNKQNEKLKDVHSFIKESKQFQSDFVKQKEIIEKKVTILEKKASLLTKTLAKNAVRIKDLQQVQKVAGPDKTTLALVSSLNIIASSLGIVNKTLSKIAAGKATGAEQVAAPQAAATAPAVAEKKSEESGGLFGLLKSLFTNPAVLAAMAGIVYTILPKDKQEQIKAFLGGFADGLNEAMGKNENEGLKGFNTVLKTAGIALTTYFGAKMIAGIADAITTTVRVAKLVGVGVKKLGRGGAAALAVGAAAGAAVMMGGKKGEEEEGEASKGTMDMGDTGAAAPTPESKPAPAATAKPSDTSPPKPPPGASKSGSNIPDNIDLKSVLTVGPNVDLDGLDPAAKKRLAGMAYEYHQKTGKKMQVNSAYRDSKKQAELYAKIGPPNAAPPGKSWHEKGLAFDINSADADTAAQLGLMDKYGFKRPVKKEPWHVELSETRGGPAYADNPASPGTAVAVVDKSGKPEIPASGKPANVGTAVASVQPSATPNSNLSAEPVTGQNSTGAELNTASQEVKHAQRPQAATNVASVDNSSKGTTKQQGQPVQAPIPSPIASRGSLGAFTRHNTAYA